jgi:hypothetical protein
MIHQSTHLATGRVWIVSRASAGSSSVNASVVVGLNGLGCGASGAVSAQGTVAVVPRGSCQTPPSSRADST